MHCTKDMYSITFILNITQETDTGETHGSPIDFHNYYYDTNMLQTLEPCLFTGEPNISLTAFSSVRIQENANKANGS